MDREIEFDDIEENLVDKSFEDSEMTCTFECPATGEQFEGTARIRAVGKRQSMFNRVSWIILRWVGRMVRRATGSYTVSRWARNYASKATDKAAASAGLKYSDETVQNGVVEAFEDIQSQFVWDAERGQWIADETVVDEAGWLTELLEEAAGSIGGQVVDGTGGRPELRWELDGRPTRLVVDESNRPSLQMQADVGRRAVTLEWQQDAAEMQDDPWADGGESQTVVGDEVVAFDDHSAEHFDDFPADYQNRLTDFLRQYQGDARIDSDRQEFSSSIPLNRIDDRPNFVDTAVELADATTRALEK